MEHPRTTQAIRDAEAAAYERAAVVAEAGGGYSVSRIAQAIRELGK